MLAPTAPIVAPPRSSRPRQVPAPASLTIPQIGVRTRLVSLGLTAQGAIQVPATTAVAGWYTRSPRPGAVGPAIILGHIDSYQGPGVFFLLADHFPTQAVYGPTPDAELRLITCGGAFDTPTGHYLSHIVASATQTG
jgi:hypothetical protein